MELKLHAVVIVLTIVLVSGDADISDGYSPREYTVTWHYVNLCWQVKIPADNHGPNGDLSNSRKLMEMHCNDLWRKNFLVAR